MTISIHQTQIATAINELSHKPKIQAISKNKIIFNGIIWLQDLEVNTNQRSIIIETHGLIRIGKELITGHAVITATAEVAIASQTKEKTFI